MSDLADDMVVEEGSIRSSVDTQGRRKRHRQRRKRKVGTPYSPRRRIGTPSVRAQEVRNEMFTHGQPVAPFNTTQFIMEDHNLQNIDAQLSKPPADNLRPRTRDSSFSIDSDDDFFYSSPEDEEEFLTKEFSLEYQDLHVERLNNLPKMDIIRDYLVLESKYEKSMGELRKLKTDSGRDTDASSKSDADVSEQLKLAHLENRRLKAELEKIKRENALLQKLRQDSDDSSVDSESDSSSGSSSSSSIVSDSEPASPCRPDLPSEAPAEETRTVEVGFEQTDTVKETAPSDKVEESEVQETISSGDVALKETTDAIPLEESQANVAGAELVINST